MRENYDFSHAKKNPFAGTFNGEYTVIIENEGYNEVVKYDYNKIPHMREIIEIIPIGQESKPKPIDRTEKIAT